VELNEQSVTPTLAHKLGDVPHVSGWLRRFTGLAIFKPDPDSEPRNK
jgi:hypothetical protein